MDRIVKNALYGIFYLLNVGVFMLILLAVISVDLSLWWLDNLLNLQLQWTLLALLLTLINLIWVKKLRVICFFLYSAAIAYNLLPLYLPVSQSTAAHTAHDAQKLTIAQLNLSYDNPNIKQLIPLLGTQDIDLLVIQEASDREYENINKLSQYYPYSFGVSGIESTPSGLAIFSRYQITEKKIHNSDYKGGQFLEVILQMPRSVAPVQLYALHPASPRNEKLWQQREQTLTTIANAVNNSPFSNQIVIGDFNSSPWSNVFQHFSKSSGLKNSALGFGYIPSWSHSNKILLNLLSSAYIDHCLLSRSFQVISKHAQPVQGSDHQLLLTELAF